MWQTVAAVAAGGAAGSVFRFLLSQQMLHLSSAFPWGTFVINVTGSFLIGFFARALSGPTADPVLRVALTVGFCGGFTTFSTYSSEMVLLIEQARAMRALVYMLSSTVASVTATVAGLSLGGTFAGR